MSRVRPEAALHKEMHTRAVSAKPMLGFTGLLATSMEDARTGMMKTRNSSGNAARGRSCLKAFQNRSCSDTGPYFGLERSL